VDPSLLLLLLLLVPPLLLLGLVREALRRWLLMVVWQWGGVLVSHLRRIWRLVRTSWGWIHLLLVVLLAWLLHGVLGLSLGRGRLEDLVLPHLDVGSCERRPDIGGVRGVGDATTTLWRKLLFRQGEDAPSLPLLAPFLHFIGRERISLLHPLQRGHRIDWS